MGRIKDWKILDAILRVNYYMLLHAITLHVTTMLLYVLLRSITLL